MKELINDPLFQMVAGIVISAILSIYLSYKFSSRKSVLFEINNVFQLSDNRLSSFKRLDISINGKRILEDNTRIFLVEFEFTNIGNKDIRFSKDDGQFLKLILDKQFEIIDINDEDLGILDIENNSINLNIKSFKIDETISIQAIIRNMTKQVSPESEKIGMVLLAHTKLLHDIEDLKKIKTEYGIQFAINSIIIIGISILFIGIGIYGMFNNIYQKVTISSVIVGLILILMGIFMFRAFFKDRKRLYNFNKRQNRLNLF